MNSSWKMASITVLADFYFCGDASMVFELFSLLGKQMNESCSHLFPDSMTHFSPNFSFIEL